MSNLFDFGVADLTADRIGEDLATPDDIAALRPLILRWQNALKQSLTTTKIQDVGGATEEVSELILGIGRGDLTIKENDCPVDIVVQVQNAIMEKKFGVRHISKLTTVQAKQFATDLTSYLSAAGA